MTISQTVQELGLYGVDEQTHTHSHTHRHYWKQCHLHYAVAALVVNMKYQVTSVLN